MTAPLGGPPPIPPVPPAAGAIKEADGGAMHKVKNLTGKLTGPLKKMGSTERGYLMIAILIVIIAIAFFAACAATGGVAGAVAGLFIVGALAAPLLFTACRMKTLKQERLLELKEHVPPEPPPKNDGETDEDYGERSAAFLADAKRAWEEKKLQERIANQRWHDMQAVAHRAEIAERNARRRELAR